MPSIKTQGTHIHFVDASGSSPAVVKLACPTGVSGLGGAKDQIEDTCLDATEDKTYVAGLKDASGRVSVRFTPHETAAALCRLAGGALVATRANKSGGAPAASPDALDPDVDGAVEATLTAGSAPAGGPASTVARLDGDRRLTIFREGATPLAALEAAGFIYRREQAL